MGIYDREYVRREPQGFSLGGGRSVVVNLVLLNAAIYVVDMLFFADGHKLMYGMACRASDLMNPLLWWRFLTAGFAHDPRSLGHIALNMFGLWMFGRDIEGMYGPREFLRLYLTMIVFSMVGWAAVAAAQGDMNTYALGASGAVTGVIVLYAMHFPRRTLLLYFVIPIPAWLVGVLIIGYDVLGSMRPGGGDHVAHSAHLAGAAFAAAYRYWGWNLGSWLPGRGSRFSRLLRQPKLRVHEPNKPETDLSRRVDEILEKISTKGEESLTKEERRTLEEASRRYQRRRR